MTRAISVLCGLALCAWVNTPANAQPACEKATPSKRATPSKKKRSKKVAKRKAAATSSCPKNQSRDASGCVKSMIFDKDEISGETPNGYGDFLTATRKVIFDGLIRLRTNFHAEILKSAADI